MNNGHAQSILLEADEDPAAPEDGPWMPRARYGFTLVNHSGVMIVARNSGIDSVADLPGKKVNLGVEGSHTRRIWDEVLEANGLSTSDLGGIVNATRDDDLRALCEGEIDVYLSLVGLIPPALVQTGARCGARVVSLEDDGGPAELYGNGRVSRSLDFGVSLVFHEKVPNYVTCNMARVLHEHPQLLLLQHLALAEPDEDDMLIRDMGLPLHPGIEQYRQEGTCPTMPKVSGVLDLSPFDGTATSSED